MCWYVTYSYMPCFMDINIHTRYACDIHFPANFLVRPHKHRTILELLRHSEKEHKENLGIYKLHACTRQMTCHYCFRCTTCFFYRVQTVERAWRGTNSHYLHQGKLCISSYCWSWRWVFYQTTIKVLRVCLHRYTYYKVLLRVLPGWSLPWA